MCFFLRDDVKSWDAFLEHGHSPTNGGFQARNLRISRGLFSEAMLVSGRVNSILLNKIE